ncbi:hypothetical protein G6O69_15345 [Pseudenhygromyxa sp. WMMC2535]|uniref:hypothetical protein n=1 Tax=Pseudenhygromyxa sp. WMMC2535 TaxID=2712867 RepID=UPI001594E982|nr:hypothetical protein [Pseudenhygromyxa sp. WMMC2535]NVB39217.1 hypothetical protein [Pseudenhygromyxa sp. WMMC2535]
MASRPAKRPPRKTPPPGSRRPRTPEVPPLVDPDTVAAVRRSTAKAVHLTVRVTRAMAAALKTTGHFMSSWLGPRLRRGAAVAAKAAVSASSAAARWSWAHRSGLTRVGHRLMWWTALAILVLVGRALLGSGGDPELLASATFWFATGLAMSVLVLLGAPEARMRVGAFALAGGHGSLCMLAYLVANGA